MDASAFGVSVYGPMGAMEPILVGRKPRRAKKTSRCLFAAFAPGLSRSLPADDGYFGL